MLSVAKLVPGQAGYYEELVAQGRDDYYAGRGEAPGRWLGTAAGELGLSGELARGELEGLLRMEVPGREAPLRRTAAERRITVERLDPRTGEPITERVTLRPLGGYDLVFSTPKSLSVLEQLADPETPEGAHILRTVERAHEAGLQAALAYLEERACVVRMGAGGTERAPGSGFVAARFDHRTSRAQEPHRHSHVIVANAVRGPDGKWRALDGRLLLEEHRLAAGYLYEAVLRQATSAQGFRWGPVDKGMAELEGVPRELLRRLSTRREQIEEHMAAQGTRDFRGAQTAALLTRDRKPREGLDLVARRAEWRAIAAEHGLGREEVRALGRQALELAFGRALGTAPPIAAPSLSALAERLSGPAGLTATRNSFTRPEALRAVAGAHQQGATRERLEAMVDGYLARPEVVSLLVDRGGRERFSTRDLLACEARILAHAAGGRGASVGVLRAGLVEGVIGARAAGGRPLSAEQAGMVRGVTRSGRRLDVVQALAGTGKTVVLGAIAECYVRAGYLVVGAAPTARAARELAGAGVNARTLDGLVASLAARGGFPAGRPVLVLLDEAGAAGSRAWAALCAYAEAAGAKEVCAGDAGQLQSVPAGGAFRALARAPEALSLRQVLRQREPQHRAALGALHDGDGASYLGFLLARGALHVAGREEAVAGAVRQWAEAQAELPWGQSALIARDNALRAELNAHARAEARVRGWVTGPALRVEVAGGEEREYRVGERVIARQNRRDLDTDNGDRGTVTEVDARRGQIAVLVDDGRRVRYPLEYLSRGLVEHAYALTGHGAQGGTLEATPIVGRPQDHSREWTYTAASRERTLSGVWLIEEERERDPGHDLPEVPLPLADPILRLGRALERTEAEDLALEQWAAPGGWAPEWETEASSGLRTATEGRLSRDPLLGYWAQPAEKPARESGPESTPSAPGRDPLLPRWERELDDRDVTLAGESDASPEPDSEPEPEPEP